MVSMDRPFTFNMLPSFIVEKLHEKNIVEPTHIQKEMIPLALQGENVVGRSKTGTGKTLAFLLPALSKINMQNNNIQVLILAPTQELAMQLVHVTREYIDESMKVGAFIGGANMKRQLERLRKEKPQIAIGTPGRVLQLIETRKLKIHDVQIVIIDEGDELAKENAAWKAVEQISHRVKKSTQFLFTSATTSPSFLKKIGRLGRKITHVESSKQLIPTEHVDHLYIQVEERDKIDVARRLIHAENITKGMIFVNELQRVKEIVEKLAYKGIKIAQLSSKSTSQQRERVLAQFHREHIHILVATDVLARGLDVADVTHIIQLDAPADANSYLHRAGRTGRMEKSGRVITLINENEKYKLQRYEKELHIQLTEKVLSHGKIRRKR